MKLKGNEFYCTTDNGTHFVKLYYYLFAILSLDTLYILSIFLSLG